MFAGVFRAVLVTMARGETALMSVYRRDKLNMQYIHAKEYYLAMSDLSYQYINDIMWVKSK